MEEKRLCYERTATVLMRDCNMYKCMKPSAILELFQEVSESLTEGWGVGLDKMLERGLIWVAARIGAEIIRLPVHNEIITLRGWLCSSRGGLYPYHCEVRDAEGNVLITGTSLWVLSDAKEHTMFSDRVPALHLPSPEPKPLNPRLTPIRPAAEFQQSVRRVKFSECDINGHFTNSRYLDWVSDLLDADFHRTHPLRGLRIDYRSEIFPDEEITLDWVLESERLWCRAQGRFDAMLQY